MKNFLIYFCVAIILFASSTLADSLYTKMKEWPKIGFADKDCWVYYICEKEVEHDRNLVTTGGTVTYRYAEGKNCYTNNGRKENIHKTEDDFFMKNYVRNFKSCGIKGYVRGVKKAVFYYDAKFKNKLDQYEVENGRIPIYKIQDHSCLTDYGWADCKKWKIEKK